MKNKKNFIVWLKLEKEYFQKLKIIQGFLGTTTHVKTFEHLIDFFLRENKNKLENFLKQNKQKS